MAHAEVIVRAPDRGRARAVRDLAGDAGSEIVDVSRLPSKVEAKDHAKSRCRRSRESQIMHGCRSDQYAFSVESLARQLAHTLRPSRFERADERELLGLTEGEGWSEFWGEHGFGNFHCWICHDALSPVWAHVLVEQRSNFRSTTVSRNLSNPNFGKGHGAPGAVGTGLRAAEDSVRIDLLFFGSLHSRDRRRLA